MAADFPIISKLGGRAKVRQHLERIGKPRSQKALEMWMFRRRMPGDIQTALMRVAAESGIPVDWSDFERPAADAASEAA